jgi:SAM-dependent methyltransferase
VLDKLRTLAPPRPRGEGRALLLDIGCGGGWAFDDFSRFYDVYGLEPDQELAQALPRWRARIERRPFGPHYPGTRQYDMILMLDVLEHLADDRGAVANLHHLLKPGGRVLLTVPALPILWSVHDEVNHHFRRYTWKGLRRVLAEQGFEIEELRYVFGWSLGLMLARRWLSGGKRDAYRVRVPPAWINAPLRWLSRFEEFVIRIFGGGPLLGSSLLALARKPAAVNEFHPAVSQRRAA